MIASESLLKAVSLYSEDDLDSREMVLFTLRWSGYDVTCVDSGSEALSLAKTEQFDLFLVDNWMSELSGPELTRDIREFNQTLQSFSTPLPPTTPTNRSLLTQGGTKLPRKPVAIEQLITEIEKLIAETRRSPLRRAELIYLRASDCW